MENTQMINYIKDVLNNMPADWLKLTTHRLDIYNESLAKTEFLDQFEALYNANNAEEAALKALPTAFDYIRLGHPLSCVLEWIIARENKLDTDSVITFSSKITPILAVLRKNLFAGKNTRIVYQNELPACFDAEAIQSVYGYQFELKKINALSEIDGFDGSTLLISEQNDLSNIHYADQLPENVDFLVTITKHLGSIILANGEVNKTYVSEIQHVRRRETISMTPSNCLVMLNKYAGIEANEEADENRASNKATVSKLINEITNTQSKVAVGSSGLSIQYAIAMGLIDNALQHYPGKEIKFVVPPNCYGGTNDQARRVAACLDNVEVVDLPVDSGNDMVQSINRVLDGIAQQDAVPLIIVEIPTNPRVEVPDLQQLRETLVKERKTANGETAIDPVFILDQTFCPNVHFLGENDILSPIRAISYASGSKFPSGGLCTSGYCVANGRAASLMNDIEKHLLLCDNEATDQQYEILAKQLPSMNQRIADAYVNTRSFVSFIEETLPEAKINFVSEELAAEGFTPSVFSLDLPTKGNTDEEREAYKREKNLQLINMMIQEIPNESKFCVSYGQLKGCYWTIPATSTQGTTKEGDKDYIVRVSLSGNMDLDHHKKVFSAFVNELK
ncbi:MAG: PLP-dependent transferase [Flavobacteriales bacterium]|nr:PLP-dependent transferase [Flavobacteriales bacterium]